MTRAIRAVTVKGCDASDACESAEAAERVRAYARDVLRADTPIPAWAGACAARACARAVADTCCVAVPVTSAATVTDTAPSGPTLGISQSAACRFIVHVAAFDLSVRPAIPGGRSTDRWIDRAADLSRFVIVAV